MEIFNSFASKKVFYGLLFILIIAGLVMGIWYWKDAVKRSALERQLKTVEEQISATEERIKELSELTLEELQEIEREREILSAERATKDVEVAGVEVIREGDKKIIKNTAEGYRIEIPKKLVIARSISADWLELHDSATMCEGDPSCNPVLRIVVQTENIKDTLSAAENYETLNISGQTVYKVPEVIPTVFEGSYYYWSRSGKIYSIRVSSFDESAYYKYIETFRLE